MTAIATLTMNPALDVSTATPVITPVHKLRCTDPRQDGGGGGINVARAVCALGGSALAIYPAGGGTGERISALLEQEGVPTRSIAIAGTTRESFTVDETSTGQQYRFVLPGPKLSQAEQALCLEALATLEPRPRWLVASGSLPPGLPDCFHLILGGLCRSLGIELVLDSSGPALSECDQLNALLIKPSLTELETVAGHPLPNDAAEDEAARGLIARNFARAVLVSLGGRGALLVTAELTRRYPAFPVQVRSTVGAGDSMLAAIVLRLSQGWPLEDAVQYGVAAGAAALMAPGTSLARKADVDALYAQQTATTAATR